MPIVVGVKQTKYASLRGGRSYLCSSPVHARQCLTLSHLFLSHRKHHIKSHILHDFISLLSHMPPSFDTGTWYITIQDSAIPYKHVCIKHITRPQRHKDYNTTDYELEDFVLPGILDFESKSHILWGKKSNIYINVDHWKDDWWILRGGTPWIHVYSHNYTH